MSLWNFDPNREFTLTPRRKQALLYAAAGLGIKEFSKREQIAYDTAKCHLRYARFIYNAPTSAAAVARALQVGDITYEEIQAMGPLNLDSFYE